MFNKVVFPFCLFVLLAACKKEEDVSEIPELTTSSSKVNNNELTIFFGFTDGDGDIGVDTQDTLSAPNFQLDYYEYEKGEWVLFEELRRENKIGFIVPRSKSKVLKGTIEVEVGSLFYNFIDLQNDSFRYVGMVRDQAGNISNAKETEIFLKSDYQ
jgi:hypothetical protein